MKITHVRNGIEPGDGDPRHGSANGYNNLGCRCPDCRDANAARQRDYMARRVARSAAA